MAKDVTVLAGLTAEDMSWLREVVRGELATPHHWKEPAPAGFAERLDGCQTLALSTLEQVVLEKEREIEDLKAERRP